MDLKTLSPNELHWDLDFAPRSPWPSFMPVIAILFEDKLQAVSGFDQKSNNNITVLSLECTAHEICTKIYESLAPLEELRLFSRLKLHNTHPFLLSLPKDLQDYCDDRSVALKVLKPLEHLTHWTNEIAESFLNLKPTASQIREILDLLCDLKFQGKTFLDCSSKTEDPNKWILYLKKLRFPLNSTSDERATKAVQTLPWPRGVQAKWERQGDQAGVAIQVKINSPREWKNLKESFGKLALEDGVWKS